MIRLVQQIRMTVSWAWARQRHIGVALVALVIIGSGTLFWHAEHEEFVESAAQLRHAHLSWLLIACLTVPVSMALSVAMYRLVLRALGVHPPAAVVWRAFLRSLVVGTIVPFGSLASNVVFIRELAQDGVRADAAVAASILIGVLNYAAFMLLLVPALILLALDSQVSAAMVLAAAFLALLFGCLIVLLQWLRRASGPGMLRRYLSDRILAPLEHVRALDIQRSVLLWALVVDVVSDLLAVAALYLSLRALGHSPTAAQALGSVELGTISGVVVPLLQGAGTVELTMTTVLARLGVPGGAALGASLLYRCFALWLPVLVAAVFVAGQWCAGHLLGQPRVAVAPVAVSRRPNSGPS